MEPDDTCKCGHLYHSECMRNGGCSPAVPEPPDEFDDLREAWDRFAADLKTALLDIVIRTAYRVAWAIDRIKHG